jgi:predicted permease
MFNSVGPGYFSQLGMPLIGGREFTPADTPASQKVAVVNQTFARHFFGAKNPIGRRFGMGGGKDVKLDTEIVGVVKDANYSSVRGKVPKLYFLSYRQSAEVGSIQVYVRTALPTGQTVAQIRRVMARLDPDLPLENLRTMEEQIRRNIQSDRLVLQLASAFALLATALAMLGLYGVMAHNVARRTREIGIRMALGAGTGRIQQMVLREVALILGVGAAIGAPAALGLARFAESQLFGVSSFDAGVLVGALLALSIAAFLAGLLPARRASNVNPISALRYE